MAKVYLETSFVSYLVARRSRDLIVAARQQLTNDWWDDERQKYDLFASEVVLEEARLGDPTEIAKRLQVLSDLPILTTTGMAGQLANDLLVKGALPAKAARDALHIAVATVNGMDYLLTWNCKHIANPHARRMIDRIFQTAGYLPPVICTPQEFGEKP